MATTPKLPIDLTPTPGFCIKSTVVNPATLKVFINICYDKNVPPPPPADEEIIKRAMTAQDDNEDLYHVPVVVSHPREDKDKAGNPSLVIDCVYNTTLKSRTLKDPEFKMFLAELALQRIEAQTLSLTLSRQIGTPNIAAKGKLEPRRVWVPTWLATGQQAPGKSEIEDNVAGASASQESPQRITRDPQRLLWSWRKEGDQQLMVVVAVSKETPYDTIAQAALDIEPRRLILRVPGSAKSPPLELDIDLSRSDAEIVATAPGASAAVLHGTDDDDKMKEPSRTLLLKRQRDFDVDQASAEWRIAEGELVIHV
ncbi:PIH1 domain-containing protein 1 [Leucoagaricus sp. SymC.cos]|nr:PIH1 domain-containing protein 1 [Leucoagaricus sp. SymC.cos]